MDFALGNWCEAEDRMRKWDAGRETAKLTLFRTRPVSGPLANPVRNSIRDDGLGCMDLQGTEGALLDENTETTCFSEASSVDAMSGCSSPFAVSVCTHGQMVENCEKSSEITAADND